MKISKLCQILILLTVVSFATARRLSEEQLAPVEEEKPALTYDEENELADPISLSETSFDEDKELEDPTSLSETSGDDEEVAKDIATPRTTSRFDFPSYKERRVDWCKNWASNCGKPAADLFCRNMGYQRSTSFMIQNNHGGPTNVLGHDGMVCWAPFCDSFRYINCFKPTPPMLCRGTRNLGPHLWGQRIDDVKCGRCPTGTTQSDYNVRVWHTGDAGSCAYRGWRYPWRPGDCSIRLRFIESGGMLTGKCHWRLERI